MCGPTIWNKLPQDLQSTDTVGNSLNVDLSAGNMSVRTAEGVSDSLHSRLRGAFTARRYTNQRLPLPLPLRLTNGLTCLLTYENTFLISVLCDLDL